MMYNGKKTSKKSEIKRRTRKQFKGRYKLRHAELG